MCSSLSLNSTLLLIYIFSKEIISTFLMSLLLYTFHNRKYLFNKTFRYAMSLLERENSVEIELWLVTFLWQVMIICSWTKTNTLQFVVWDKSSALIQIWLFQLGLKLIAFICPGRKMLMGFLCLCQFARNLLRNDE